MQRRWVGRVGWLEVDVDVEPEFFYKSGALKTPDTIGASKTI
jgi:hypothetical protein